MQRAQNITPRTIDSSTPRKLKLPNYQLGLGEHQRNSAQNDTSKLDAVGTVTERVSYVGRKDYIEGKYKGNEPVICDSLHIGHYNSSESV